MPETPLVRPVVTWSSRLPFTAIGQWVKNSIPTGNDGPTYADTAEGDIISWDETATDSLGGTSKSIIEILGSSNLENNHYISAKLIALANSSTTAIESRLIDKTPDVAQHLFSNTTANWTEPTFVPNTQLWCQDLRSQLTGVHMFVSGGWLQGYGLQAITPRHAISCAHNGPAGNRNHMVRYVNTDGTVFETTILKWIGDTWPAQAHKLSVPPLPYAEGMSDLSVYLFADPLPEWVYKAPVLGGFANMQQAVLWDSGMTTIAVSQGSWTTGPDESNTLRNRKVYPKRIVGRGYQGTMNPIVASFYHDVRVGDSGTPEFMLIDDTLYLYSIITRGGGGGVHVSNYVDYINSMIGRADAAAIASGHLTAPTNYTLTVVPLSTVIQ
jgi:hypothetical protein